MTEILRPQSDHDLAQHIAGALAEKMPLEVRGRGSKLGLGRPVQAARVLDLSGLSGITLYEPEELFLQARPATHLAEVEAALSKNNQELAFEPCDLGPLLGGVAGAGSLGGALACNLSGPRRIKAGAARDHFLGVSAYSGRAELFKAGGRVVKNVTGYDLCKLLANSYGTLCVMTSVTVKVLPAAEKTRTVLALGLDDATAIAALTAALASSHEISGAAHLPASIAARSKVDFVGTAATSVTALRIEGPAASVAHRCAAVRGLIGGAEELHSQNSRIFWRELRDVEPFVGDPRAVWRISVAPQAGPALGNALRGLGAVEVFYDWGGGLLWAAVPLASDGIAGDALAAAIRAAVAAAGGGHAMLVRAPEDMRLQVPVFQPQPEGLAALTRRVKTAFDPSGILNPGRIAAGM